MPLPFNGKRLKEARHYRQLSISQLASLIGVSKQMISKYEHNEAQPTPINFQKIVLSLNFPLSFFEEEDNFDYDNFGTFYRSRLTSTQLEKKPSEFFKKYLAVLVNFFEQYVDFPLLNEFNLSENPCKAADQLRKKWNLGKEPITNMLSLLEQKGFHLASVSSTSQKIDAFGGLSKVNGQDYYCIVIDQDNNSFYRQQFSLAHELGHWILHSKILDPQELDPQDYREIEKQANLFASCFLLPSSEFLSDINGYQEDLSKYLNLKKKWQVSVSSMIYRAKSLNIISPQTFVKLQKNINSRGWKNSEPFDVLKPVPKPTAMKQAFDLLTEAEIIGDNSLESLIEQAYHISLPPKITAELLGISIEQVTKSNKGKMVQLKVIRNKE